MRFLLLSALVPLVSAAADGKLQLAVQTIDAVPPAPTPPPEEWLVRWRLQPRQAATASNTCGWINGNSANAVTCNSGLQCGYNTNGLVFGCCTGALSTCVLPTVCFDGAFASTLAVSANAYTRLCVESTAAYCQTYIHASGFYGFGCGTVNEFYYVSGTAGNLRAGGVTAGFGASDLAGDGSAITAGGFNGASGGTTASPTAGVGSSGSSGGSGSSGSSGGSSSGNTSNGPAISTGAIVGISIAGAAIALAVIGLIAFCFHKKHKAKQAAIVYQQPPPPMQQPPQMYYGPPSPPGPGSQVGSVAPSQAMTNIGSVMHGQQPGEWDFAKQGQAQPYNDGIKVTEITPDDAVDERRQHEMMSNVGSNMAPTAVAPTMVSHQVQNV